MTQLAGRLRRQGMGLTVVVHERNLIVAHEPTMRQLLDPAVAASGI